MATGEPLSDKRLAEIREWIADRPPLGEFVTIRDLLAEVDRLRRELAEAEEKAIYYRGLCPAE